MAMIPLQHITPGMVLASDVLDMSGRLLLGRAAVITEKHVKIFRTWGVAEVNVLDLEDSGPAQRATESQSALGNPILLQQARELASDMFSGNRHPLHRLILACATRSIYRRLERGNSPHVC